MTMFRRRPVRAALVSTLIATAAAFAAAPPAQALTPMHYECDIDELRILLNNFRWPEPYNVGGQTGIGNLRGEGEGRCAVRGQVPKRVRFQLITDTHGYVPRIWTGPCTEIGQLNSYMRIMEDGGATYEDTFGLQWVGTPGPVQHVDVRATYQPGMTGTGVARFLPYTSEKCLGMPMAAMIVTGAWKASRA
jgi:hypothetical protein